MKTIIFSPGWNCGPYVWAHMNSVFEQRTSFEYTMDIIVNDASTDDTKEKLEACKQPWQKIYHNENNLGWLANSIKYLDPEIEDDDIIVWLDLDDWFIDKNALKKIIDVYRTKDVWTTYGKYKRTDNEHVENHGYPPHVLNNRNYRAVGWYWHHPRTFKGFLWKAIDKSQFIDPSTHNYIKTAGDLAIGFAILEMCPANKIYWFPDEFVMYNRLVNNNDDKKDKNAQIKYDKYFRSLPKYKILNRN